MPVYSSVSIYQMVLNRLPFLADTPTNQTLVGSFIWEVMAELDACFNVNKTNTAYDPDTGANTWVGDEDKYTDLQRIIVADLTACAIIAFNMAANSAGTATGGENGTAVIPKYMSRSKAGSVEVEWKGFDKVSSIGFYTTGDAMYKLYKEAGMRKALTLGCIIDITSEMGFKLWEEGYGTETIPSFIVVEGCSTNNRYIPPEQGGPYMIPSS